MNHWQFAKVIENDWWWKNSNNQTKKGHCAPQKTAIFYNWEAVGSPRDQMIDALKIKQKRCTTQQSTNVSIIFAFQKFSSLDNQQNASIVLLVMILLTQQSTNVSIDLFSTELFTQQSTDASIDCYLTKLFNWISTNALIDKYLTMLLTPQTTITMIGLLSMMLLTWQWNNVFLNANACVHWLLVDDFFTQQSMNVCVNRLLVYNAIQTTIN